MPLEKEALRAAAARMLLAVAAICADNGFLYCPKLDLSKLKIVSVHSENIFVLFSNVWGRASQQRRLVVGWSGGDLCRLRILLDDSSTTIVPRTT